MARSVIVSAVRTPVGKFGSALRERSAVELGAVAIGEAVERAGIEPAEIDHDAMGHDGLWSTFTGQHMGESSDEVNEVLQISRREQDAWAARSHRRAAEARRTGRFADELAGVESRNGGGVVAEDEGIRPEATADSLAQLPPAFGKSGTITAGNASQLSDGAAAVVVMSAERAAQLGLEPLAEIVA